MGRGGGGGGDRGVVPVEDGGRGEHGMGEYDFKGRKCKLWMEGEAL